ncbi:MAG: pilus assembly protein PilM [Endozoicomonas sp. (ex Botrylloides leachii)]|nr:pilus assembly protein PilM [Endozoicomonas sp. (ex Botrylloides leachii)]
MFALFEKKNKIFLGVDISSTAIKLIELSLSRTGYRVEAFGSECLPDGAIVENNIHDTEIVGKVIEKALTRSGSRLKQAAIAVSGAAVITKLIEMDASLSDSEMDAQIVVEADQYVPYPLDEVAIDFEVQSLSADNPQRANVLLAACRSENVELREEVLAIAGLEASVVDVEALVMERAFSLVEGQVTTDEINPLIAVVNIGAFSTSLYVLQKGKTIYTREQIFGGQQLTENIEKTYDMTPVEAERAKKNNQLPDDYEHRVLDPFRTSVIQHISRSLQFFYSSSEYDQVNAVILSGGTASVQGLAEALQKNLATDTVIANPFADMSLSRKVNAANLKKEAPALMIACGLAMRSFD